MDGRMHHPVTDRSNCDQAWFGIVDIQKPIGPMPVVTTEQGKIQGAREDTRGQVTVIELKKDGLPFCSKA